MTCVVCKNQVPRNNYALVQDEYYCLACFLKSHNQLLTVQTECQVCGSRPLSSCKAISQRIGTFGSTTSLNSTKSKSSSRSSRSIGRVISNAFHRFRSSSPAATLPNPIHGKPPIPSKKRTMTCQVCFDDKPSRYFRPMFNHACSQARRTICDTCIYNHIKQSFQEMYTDNVCCPELECNIKYNYETIKHILLLNNEMTLFENYDRFICLNELEKMEEFIWCSNPVCQMGQLNEGGEANNIVVCMRCQKKTCFKHKTKWHKGLTCDQFDLQIDGNARATLRWLNQNTKTCPNCPYQIEKNDGCDHMTCIKCHYEFCWVCLADYNTIRRHGNHQHRSDCKHYRR